jgi:hypothetical protein
MTACLLAFNPLALKKQKLEQLNAKKPERMHASMQTLAKENVSKKGKRKTTSAKKQKKKRLRERLHATFAKKCKPEGMHASMQTLAKENVRKNKGKRKTTSAKKTKKDYKNDCMQRLPKKT